MDLLGKMSGCQRCNLRSESSLVVVPEGPLDADILIVGRNPGKTEDEEGRPFVGPGGKLLGNWILELGMTRSEVLITNACMCHSTNDRPLEQKELDQCRFWVTKLVALAAPKLIVTLGNDAFRTITGTSKSVMEEHGNPRVIVFGGIRVLVFPMLHPGQVLRQRSLENSIVRSDMEKLKNVLADMRRM